MPGGRAAVNPTGNPGMATGGTGDVLAGVVGALVRPRSAGARRPRVSSSTGGPATSPPGPAGRTASWPATSPRPFPRPSRAWAGPREARHRRADDETEKDTLAVAEELAAGFRGGEVVLLSGELGAGKTVFVRGLARGLGADPDEVSSPTFVLLTSYPGRLTLHHADLYRLSGDGDDDGAGARRASRVRTACWRSSGRSGCGSRAGRARSGSTSPTPARAAGRSGSRRTA